MKLVSFILPRNVFFIILIFFQCGIIRHPSNLGTNFWLKIYNCLCNNITATKYCPILWKWFFMAFSFLFSFIIHFDILIIDAIYNNDIIAVPLLQCCKKLTKKKIFLCNFRIILKQIMNSLYKNGESSALQSSQPFSWKFWT